MNYNFNISGVSNSNIHQGQLFFASRCLVVSETFLSKCVFKDGQMCNKYAPINFWLIDEFVIESKTIILHSYRRPDVRNP
jgi:hypothetical protein